MSTTELIPFSDKRFSASPSPETPIEVSDDGKSVTMYTNHGTDWWHNFERNSQDGLVYGFEVPLNGAIEIGVELELGHTTQYDQAQLFLQIGKDTWLKTGLEFDGGLFAGAVAAYPYSDWSLQPAGSEPPSKFKVVLNGRQVQVFIGGVMHREIIAFAKGDETTARIGVMGCSPKGGKAKAIFKNFYVKQ